MTRHGLASLKDTDDVVEEDVVGECPSLLDLVDSFGEKGLLFRPIILYQNQHMT